MGRLDVTVVDLSLSQKAQSIFPLALLMPGCIFPPISFCFGLLIPRQKSRSYHTQGSQHSTIDVKHGCEDSWGLLSSTAQPSEGTSGGFSGEALMRQCCSWDRNEKWFPPLGMAVDISKHNFGIQLFAPPFQMSVLVVVTIEDGQQSAWSGQALVFPPLIGWLVVSFLP